jgi:hypothetical protein
MTKKHFIKIAEILRTDKAELDLILNLCRAFIDINPRFSKKKFIKASFYGTLNPDSEALDSWVKAEEGRL